MHARHPFVPLAVLALAALLTGCPADNENMRHDASSDRGTTFGDGGRLDVPDLRDGAMTACTPGDTRPCFTGAATERSVGVCSDGIQVCNSVGRWSTACVGETVARAIDVCGNMLDDDCNGRVDDGCD